jgi:hypothetical protein
MIDHEYLMSFKLHCMSKEQTRNLLNFLQPYSEKNKELTLWLREFVWDLYPNCNELIYDNYLALALGWSLTDRLLHSFCSIAVYEHYLHFGFYWGSQIADPENILLGKGNQYRYIKIESKDDFPGEYIKMLLKEAYAISLSKMDNQNQTMKGKTITKSISPTKKRPAVIAPKRKRSV